MNQSPRTSGDDVEITLRMRRSNLEALTRGIPLGIDSLTGCPIRVQLVKDGSAYALQVEANALTAGSTPEPVDMVEIDGNGVAERVR